MKQILYNMGPLTFTRWVCTFSGDILQHILYTSFSGTVKIVGSEIFRPTFFEDLEI